MIWLGIGTGLAIIFAGLCYLYVKKGRILHGTLEARGERVLRDGQNRR
jgi:hypothetical protein